MYKPVVTAGSEKLAVTALVGSHTAVLGFDLPGDPAARRGLLGFAIRRTALPDGPAEWLKNPLKFARFPYAGFKVAGTDSNLAPIQQFRWIDERLEPGQPYRYEVSTVFGTPERPELRHTVEIELEAAPVASGSLGLLFNRGVLATPAYRQRFDNLAPVRQPPESAGAARSYLSRGLHEGLLAFLEQAGPGDELSVAIYEFQHESVVAALRAALRRGAAVRLLYHAKDARGEGHSTARHNQAYLDRLTEGLDDAQAHLQAIPRARVARLSHNKIVLLRRRGQPAAVWTGSTNFTESGFFLQTNAGVVIHDPAIAARFADYLDWLAADPPGDCDPAVPAAGEPGGSGITRLFFSPVRGDELLRVAAGLVDEAEELVLISCPFGLEASGAIEGAIQRLDEHPGRPLAYGLLNSVAKGKLAALDGAPGDTREFTVPEWIESFNGESYDGSPGRRLKVHVKSLVVDPFGARPRVLIGSANFSRESVNDNDENALLIEGNRWAAAVVATEFLRVFEHYRFRNAIRALAEAYDTAAPRQREVGGGAVLAPEGEEADDEIWLIGPDEVLAEEPGSAVLKVVAANVWLGESDAWTAPYFEQGHPKCRARELFGRGGF